MKELNEVEIIEVSGAGFKDIGKALGRAFGWAYGAGARHQQRVDSYENSMLSAMQYGA